MKWTQQALSALLLSLVLSPGAWAAEAEWSIPYSLTARLGLTTLRSSGALPVAPSPTREALLDANIPIRIKGETIGFLFEGGVLGSWHQGFQSASAGQALEGVSPPSGQSHDHRAYLRELQLTLKLSSELRLSLGKMRVSWWPGNTANPSDVINPPRNPLDPNAARDGVWMGLFEHTVTGFSVGLFAGPGIEEGRNGIPRQILTWEEPATRESKTHGFWGAELYTLWKDWDFRALYTDTRRTRGPLDQKLLGVSAAGFWPGGSALGFVFEGVLQQNSPRTAANGQCAGLSPTACLKIGQNPLVQDDLSSRKWFPKSLLGLHYDSEEGGVLLAEWLYTAEALSVTEWESLASTLRYSSMASSQMPPIPSPNTWNLGIQKWKWTEDLYFGLLSSTAWEDHTTHFRGNLDWQWAENWNASMSYTHISQWGAARPSSGPRRSDINPILGQLTLEIKSYF